MISFKTYESGAGVALPRSTDASGMRPTVIPTPRVGEHIRDVNGVFWEVRRILYEYREHEVETVVLVAKDGG